MPLISGLRKDLASLVDRRRVWSDSADLLAYANKATRDRARAAVPAYADRHRIPVVPRGAGTSLAGGATPCAGGG